MGHPFWSKGFRPFFLVAAAFAASFLPLWLFVWTGALDVGAYWTGPVWHGHEMVYGFTLAVMAGFLLTAVGNWTRRETATGPWLAGLVGLWLAGRLAVVFAGVLPSILVAAVDLAFIPALMVAVGRPLLASENRRNYMFLGILGLFELANLAMHLDALGVLDGASMTAVVAAVDLVLIVSLVIGGRIIPMFTRNATGYDDIRSHRILDRASIVAMAAVALLNVVGVPAAVAAAVSAFAGLLVLARMSHWGTLRTLRRPILWVLHAGHAFIGVGLLLRSAAAIGWLLPTAATHVLTLGAIGLLTLGMMSRVALGHTGRPLVVRPAITLAYLLVVLAVVGRGVLPVVIPQVSVAAYTVSGVAFSLAFALYLVVYIPILVARRADQP